MLTITAEQKLFKTCSLCALAIQVFGRNLNCSESGQTPVLSDVRQTPVLASGKLLRLIGFKQGIDFRVFALDQNVLTARMGTLAQYATENRQHHRSFRTRTQPEPSPFFVGH